MIIKAPALAVALLAPVSAAAPAAPATPQSETRAPAASTPRPPDQDRAHPLSKDRTGVVWVLPFDAARRKAAEQKRLLMIKPVAFGTSKEGGW